jgi:hypothetical protein
VVCAGIDAGEARELGDYGHVIARAPASGGRFSAYQAGIAHLGDLRALTHLTLFDSSFIALNPAQLCAEALVPPAHLDVAALTMIGAPRPRLQSYWLCFGGPRVLASAAFRDWWAAGGTLDDAAMTAHFTQAGFALGAFLQQDRAERIVSLCRALACGALPLAVPDAGPVALDPDLALRIDPTIFGWDLLFGRWGVVTRELLEAAPCDVNIAALRKWLASTPEAGALVQEALESRAP